MPVNQSTDGERGIKWHENELIVCFRFVRACLHEVGGPQIGEVTCGGSPHLSCKRNQIKMSDNMDRRVTPAKRATSPSWGPPTPCKQTLSQMTILSCRRKRMALYLYLQRLFWNVFCLSVLHPALLKVWLLMTVSLVFERYWSHWLFLHGWLTACLPTLRAYCIMFYLICFQGPLTVCVQELDGSFNHTVQIEDVYSRHELPCHSKSRRLVINIM